MAKQRVVNTKFWSDNWVREKLNQLDRYLFLYFLTNEHTRISGIYELPMSSLSFETGFSRDELIGTLLPRLEPKIIVFEGWVIMPNFLKHQNINNPKIKAAVENEMEDVPIEIIEKAIAYGYPMDNLSQKREVKKRKEKKREVKVIAFSRLGKDSEINPEWLDSVSWEEWERYRREIKKTLTPMSRVKQLKLLEENKEDQKEIINNSILNGWAGLFPLKKVKETKQPRTFTAK